jgi:hypothetical protein
VWLRHFGQDAAPVFLAVHIEEEVVGMAALDISGDHARSLGDPNVRDYGGPVALPGHEDEVAGGVLEWLAEDFTSSLELHGVPAGSPMRAALEASADAFGWQFTAESEAICPTLALPGDFEAYLAALNKHERHELRRKLRHLEAAGNVRYDSVTSPHEVSAAMDTFLAFMRASRDDKDEFLTPAMEAFFRDLAPAFAAIGMARIATLSLNDAPVAMLFAFETADTTFLYNSGYDPAYAHLAVGLLSKAYAIRDAIARGHTTFDFLRGDEEYKRRIGGVPREVQTLRFQRR